MRTHKVYHYPRVKHTSRPLPAKPRSWAGVPVSISPQSSARPPSDIISGNSSPRTCFPALAARRGIQGSRPNRINCDRARPFPPDPWQGNGGRVSPECPPCRTANRAPISDLRHHAPNSLLFAPLRLCGPVPQSKVRGVRFELKAPRTFSTIMLLGTINRDARLARYTAPQKSIPLIRLKVVPSSKEGMGLAKGHGRLLRTPAAQGWRPHAWRNPGRQRRRRAAPSSDGRTIVRFSRSLSWYTNVYQDCLGVNK